MNKPLKWAAVLFVAGLSACGGNQSGNTEKALQNTQQVRHVRKSLYSPKAEKDMADLKKALGIMRAMDCDSSNSWYYQGAIHWVPDTIPVNPFCASYHYPKDLKSAWDNCTHTKSKKEVIHFLVWHRLYIYHFEKIVRKLSGDPNFSLPYWGYTDTVNAQLSRTMPAIYRDTKSSLYEKARLDSLNNGAPLHGEILEFIDLKNLFENTTYAGFNKNMNAAPHGAMHDYIGYGNSEAGKGMFNPIKQKFDKGGGLMQDVRTAAYDPIFWVHHANIDRVWQKWTNTNNGQEVTLAELKSVPWPYIFFDENGKKVEYTMEEIMKILYTMDYDYDDTPVQGKPANVLKAAPLQLQAKNALASQAPNVVVSKGITNFTVANNAAKTNLLKSSANQKVFMNVTVSYAKAPKGGYEVFLNLPKGAVANSKSDYFSGFMTFFGADHHSGMEDMKMDGMPAKMQETFTFEISKEFNLSKAGGQPNFNISIKKYGGAPQEELKVENVSVIVQ
jgi:hypothetical protein